MGAGVPRGWRAPRGRDRSSGTADGRAPALGGGRTRREDRARTSDRSLFEASSSSTAAGAIVVDREPADVARRCVRRGRRRLGCVRAHRGRDRAKARSRRGRCSDISRAERDDCAAGERAVRRRRRRRVPARARRSAPPPRDAASSDCCSGSTRTTSCSGTARTPPAATTADDRAVAAAKRDIDALEHEATRASSRRSTPRSPPASNKSPSAPPTTESPGDGVRPLVGARDPHRVHRDAPRAQNASTATSTRRGCRCCTSSSRSCRRRWRHSSTMCGPAASASCRIRASSCTGDPASRGGGSRRD